MEAWGARTAAGAAGCGRSGGRQQCCAARLDPSSSRGMRGEHGDDTVGIRTLAARGSLARGTRLAGGMATRAAAEQSREEEKRRLTGGPGRGKKETSLKFKTEMLPGSKIH